MALDTIQNNRLKDGGKIDNLPNDTTTELALKADKSNVLELDNTSAFTPAADYEPATKKYVDDNSGSGGTWGSITGTLSNQTDLQTALDGKVDENVAIVAGTGTKITYDTKGLVTSSTNATTADIAASTDKNYVTDAQAVVIGNTSGTNTGDQTSIVGITGTTAEFNTALSDGSFATGGGTATGTNTGDQDLSGLMVKASNLSDVASQQTALNNITAVSGATNEYVLTKDTATGNAIFKAAAGGGLTWGDSITNTSGTGITTTIANSALAGTIGQSIVIGDTQTNSVTGLTVDAGASGVSHILSKFTNRGGRALSINDYVGQATNSPTGLWVGSASFNTNSTFNSWGARFSNAANAGTGYNTGIGIVNSSAAASLSSSGNIATGTGISVLQYGVDGTAIHVDGTNNINASTNGLVHYALSSTQTGASVMQKINTGTSAFDHTSIYLTGTRHSIYIGDTTAPATTTNRLYSVAGALTWNGIDLTAGGGGGGAFSTTANVTSNAPGTLATDDFVFGSSSLDDDGDITHDYRMLFDKSLGAFRAGYVFDTTWDAANRGNSSAAFGSGTKASGYASFAANASTQATNNYCSAFGISSVASNQASFAWGSSTQATGSYTMAGGNSVVASGTYSAAFGYFYLNNQNACISVGYGTGLTDTTGVAVRLEADADQNGTKKKAIYIGDTTAPSTTTNRLYSVGGALHWNGTDLTAGGGGASIYEATVGATGADYTTLGAAVAAGKTRVLVIDNTTETGNITMPSGFFVDGIGKNSVNINMGVYSFLDATGANTYFKFNGVKISIGIVTARLFPTTVGELIINNCIIDLTGSVSGTSYPLGIFKNNVSNEIFITDTDILFPNRANGGGVFYYSIFNNVNLVGGGSSSYACLSLNNYSIASNIRMQGTFSASTEAIEVVGKSSLSNITSDSTAFRIRAYDDCNISDISAVNADINITGSRNAISNSVISNINGNIVGDDNVFSNITMVGSVTLTLPSGSDRNIFNNINTLSGISITGNDTTITGARVGATAGGGATTITINSGANRTIVSGCRTDAAISDSGTGTVGVANVVY